ncbi:MAG: GxxExxY protein [bacterium]
MNAESRRVELDRITRETIRCAQKVSCVLGCGFLEKVYENALAIELEASGLKVLQQHGIEVRYSGKPVGSYAADLLVEDRVLVELKAAKTLDDIHLAQCLNYLKASGLAVCLLMNFGRPKLEVKRVVNNF